MPNLNADLVARIVELAHAVTGRGAASDNNELARAIDELNDEDQIELVALMWVGRGTFTPDEWDEAMETAANERVHATSEYLMGSPHLADHLESGAEAMNLAEAVE